MTSIDLDQLARVTGGRGCGAQPQPQAGAPTDGAQDAPQAGGNLLGGFDQFLSLFQGEGFQQVVGGLRQLLGSFGGAGAPQAQPADQP